MIPLARGPTAPLMAVRFPLCGNPFQFAGAIGTSLKKQRPLVFTQKKLGTAE
jgi:hypothetical protein